ncbi:hypothetical protein A0H81_06637 [Grifola frondosa]|uniref:Uncharacterized protein n=1 Tax=Grifola frondosa TaxID=5627 RepID=A0A1C7M7Y0_GRIFR|nr:hypothetical protein A0H81_06637 [Grifola frondosa]
MTMTKQMNEAATSFFMEHKERHPQRGRDFSGKSRRRSASPTQDKRSRGPQTREPRYRKEDHRHSPQTDKPRSESHRVARESTSPTGSLFATAHTSPAKWCARSASAVTAIPSLLAQQPRHGTESNPDAGETQWVGSSTPEAQSSVRIGSDPPAARHQIPSTNTSVPAAERRTTELTDALLRRRYEGFTPFRADAWEAYLVKSGLIERYPELPSSIRYGFYIGIPQIFTTNSPANSPSVQVHSEEFNRIITHELKQKRYLGPFSRSEVESLIGPFQSSPLSLIPKTTPGALRLIQDYSYPRAPTASYKSINFAIDSSDYPCTWGTFATICLTIARLPPGSQAAVRDVAEAYRNIPLDSSQWPGTVVRISEDDKFVIDTNASFGAKPNCGIYGNADDAACDIMRSEGIGPLTKWVDDHTLFRILRAFIEEYNRRREEWRCRIEAAGGRHHDGGRIWFGGDSLPDGRTEEFDEDMCFPIRDLSSRSPRSAEDSAYTYNLRDVDEISEELGIPWQKSKDIPFTNEFPYTGFRWNISEQTVSIPPEKKSKYLAAIQEWRTSRTHTLREVQKLYGKLLHTTLVVREGRAYLTSLESMLGIFGDRPFMPRTPPVTTPSDIRWWTDTLSRPSLSRRIPRPVEVFDPRTYSNASSECGIGVCVGDRWRAWRLLPGWKGDGREIGWAEAVGFEFAIKILLKLGIPYDDFKVYGDNKGVVEGWWNGRSRNSQVNGVFRRVFKALGERTAFSRYVTSAANPADGPSRGVYPQLPYSFRPSQFLLKSVSSSSTSTPHSPPRSSAYGKRAYTPYRRPSPHETKSTSAKRSTASNATIGTTSSSKKMSSGGTRIRFNAPLVRGTTQNENRPKPYTAGLIPTPSILRPHCLARDRLRLWKPAQNRDAAGSSLSEADLQRIFDVLTSAWAMSTLEAYGAGLLLFHIVCDQKQIPENERSPASAPLISSFIATLAGSYSAKTLNSYVYGVKAWHILHGLDWRVNKDEIEALLKAAEARAPPSSKRKKRPPVTTNILIALEHN